MATKTKKEKELEARVKELEAKNETLTSENKSLDGALKNQSTDFLTNLLAGRKSEPKPATLVEECLEEWADNTSDNIKLLDRLDNFAKRLTGKGSMIKAPEFIECTNVKQALEVGIETASLNTVRFTQLMDLLEQAI